MKNDWILEVLADLRTYTQDHDMPALSKQLDRVRVVAETEIAALAPEQEQEQGKTAHDRRPAVAGRRSFRAAGNSS